MMTAHWTRDSAEWSEAKGSAPKPVREAVPGREPRDDAGPAAARIAAVAPRKRGAPQRDGGAGLCRHHRAQPVDARRVSAGRDGRAGPAARSSSPASRAPARSWSRARSTATRRARERPFVAVNCAAHPRDAPRERALRPRARRVHRRRRRPSRPVRGRPTAARSSSTRSASSRRALQAKLLRVLQEREVQPRRRHTRDRRSTCASSRRPTATSPRCVARGSVPRGPLLPPQRHPRSSCPPLRERREDIPLLAEHFLARTRQRDGQARRRHRARGARDAARRYPWPGNVRELENVIERAVALEQGRRVELATLPDYIQAGRPATPLSMSSQPVVPSWPGAVVNGGSAPATAAAAIDAGFNLEQHLQDVERQHLERALRQAGGVQTHAAELLGLSFRQFRDPGKKVRPQDVGGEMTRAAVGVWVFATAAAVAAPPQAGWRSRERTRPWTAFLDAPDAAAARAAIEPLAGPDRRPPRLRPASRRQNLHRQTAGAEHVPFHGERRHRARNGRGSPGCVSPRRALAGPDSTSRWCQPAGRRRSKGRQS